MVEANIVIHVQTTSDEVYRNLKQYALQVFYTPPFYHLLLPLDSLKKLKYYLPQKVVHTLSEKAGKSLGTLVTEGVIKLERVYGKGTLFAVHKTRDVYIVQHSNRAFIVPKFLVKMVYEIIKERKQTTSREVAEELCKKLGRKDYFEGGVFSWKKFFADRKMHITFNLSLRILRDIYNCIDYDIKGNITLISEREIE